MRRVTETKTTEIEVKRSRFIAVGQYLDDVSQIKGLVNALKSEHPQSSHVVHAAVIGERGEIYSASDDREPKNTAGRPILEVLKGSGITNILVCVVRYFGGTLLGTGGLVKAYTDAAKSIVDTISTEQIIKTATIRFSVPYHLYEKVQNAIEGEAKELSTEFLSEVTITAAFEESAIQSIRDTVREICSGKVSFYLDSQCT
ncbi:MAG: YigZ family protein [Sphaerochaetaceae bacterium]|nr:YigZ family protein [Sphaerochaetaceae bacterium]